MESQLTQLWPLLPHVQGIGSESVVRWMAKKGANVVGDCAGSLRELTNAAKTFAEWNFYIAPNPTFKKVGTRHTASDVSHWSWLLLDVDPQEPQYDAKAALDDVLWALDTETEYVTQPLVIDSGRGLQAWIRLDDMSLNHWCGTCHDSDPQQIRREVQIAMRYWLKKISDKVGMTHGCKLDTTTSDLPRIMRCPGTLNLKTGKRASLILTGEPNPAFALRLIELVPKEEYKLAVGSLALGGRRWQDAFPHLTESAKLFILEGTQEPGRHTSMWHTAMKLTELELEEPEITKALQYGNYSCRNGLGEKAPLSDKDLKHAIDTARRRGYNSSFPVRPGRLITVEGNPNG